MAEVVIRRDWWSSGNAPFKAVSPVADLRGSALTRPLSRQCYRRHVNKVQVMVREPAAVDAGHSARGHTRRPTTRGSNVVDAEASANAVTKFSCMYSKL